MKKKKAKSVVKKRKVVTKKTLRKKTLRRGSGQTKYQKANRLEKDEMFSGSIFDSEVGKTDALFVDTPVQAPVIQPAVVKSDKLQQDDKRPWWQRFFPKK